MAIDTRNKKLSLLYLTVRGLFFPDGIFTTSDQRQLLGNYSGTTSIVPSVSVDIKVAELESRLAQIRIYLQTAITVAPRNTSIKVMTAVRAALALT